MTIAGLALGSQVLSWCRPFTSVPTVPRSTTSAVPLSKAQRSCGREGRAELVGRVELQFAERLEGRCQPGWIWVEYKFTDETLLECLGLGLDSFFWVLVTGGIFHSRGIIRKQQCIMDGHSVQLDWRRRLKPGRISSRIQERRTGDILNRQFAVRTTGVV